MENNPSANPGSIRLIKGNFVVEAVEIIRKLVRADMSLASFVRHKSPAFLAVTSCERVCVWHVTCFLSTSLLRGKMPSSYRPLYINFNPHTCSSHMHFRATCKSI